MSLLSLLPVMGAVLFGFAVGGVRRGRLRSLALTRPRWWVLGLVALVCSFAVELGDVPVPAVWAIVGLCAGLVFASVNLMISGMAIVGIGIAVQLLPIAVNGAIPVRGDALVSAEIVAASDLDRIELRGARELADSSTNLEILGDVIPVPWLEQVIGFGDLILLMGLAAVIHHLLRQHRMGRHRLRASHQQRLPSGAEQKLAAMWGLDQAELA